MATRSTITVRTGINERKSVYCHWDGYPEGVGKTLKQNYNDRDKAIALVELGDMSSLGERIYPMEPTKHSFDTPEVNTTVYYGRDRGEEGTEPRVLTNSESVSSEEYNYYFDGKTWFVNGRTF